MNINNIAFTLNATFDANDLSTVTVYFNANAYAISGSSFPGSAAANFATGHHAGTISITIQKKLKKRGLAIVKGGCSTLS